MQSYIDCTFLHRVLLNVSSNCQPERRHSYICCICLAFLHYVPSNVPSNQLIGSTGSRSRPRFSQLPFWPAVFLTSLVVSENITDIFLAIWTLRARCALRACARARPLRAQANNSTTSDRMAPPPPPPYWTKITLGLTCDDFTLSLGPLEANIYVFSGGLSENDWKSKHERVHKFYSSRLIFAGTVNFFFPTWKVVPGAYSDRD